MYLLALRTVRQFGFHLRLSTVLLSVQHNVIIRQPCRSSSIIARHRVILQHVSIPYTQLQTVAHGCSRPLRLRMLNLLGLRCGLTPRLAATPIPLAEPLLGPLESRPGVFYFLAVHGKCEENNNGRQEQDPPSPSLLDVRGFSSTWYVVPGILYF